MRIGIDLGGSKIEIVALDAEGRERLRHRISTPAGDYPATVAALCALVAEAERELGVQGCSVGIGTPGSPSPIDGRMRNANSTCLNGRPLLDDLRAGLGREVRIANDANCLAVSEAVDGAAAGADVVFGAILGTGVGGGIVAHGRLLVGANAIGGEWGHSPLPLPGADDLPLPPCYCGRHGCVETYLSGPALAADHLRHSGETLDAARIAERAAAGDAVCGASVARYAERLARALAPVINLLDPDVIVLGGGLSRIDALYRDVPRLWRPYVFSDSIVTRLLPARHGDSSGVRGAVRLWQAA
ncbi:ROK family protein [Pseudothauera nasutitermitis]|uniref:ROK family protein n=1 Tax=Pseudothauera nasutitermitis TaxID=2565930 RepID=A0A4S4AMF2_9RHOO|nr:ROK family protein [Pseudothauera nasutitermitis]THF60744.1 ROK family protein [Pseudothauera nasutitermitis]